MKRVIEQKVNEIEQLESMVKKLKQLVEDTKDKNQNEIKVRKTSLLNNRGCHYNLLQPTNEA